MFRVGIVGAGGIANSHARALTALDGVRLAAVYDVDQTRAAELANSYGSYRTSTLDELIARCDAVFVCTWTGAHRHVVATVAAAGLPVFCEKPLAPTLADARAMVSTVEGAAVVNQVGLPLRWAPGFVVLRQLLADPANGRLLSATLHTEMGVRGALSGWRRDAALAGGGVLLEVGFHDVDLLEWLVGPMESLGSFSAPGNYPGIEDAASLSITFSGGGVGALVTVWHSAPALDHAPRRLHIVYENAQYLMDGPHRLTVAGPGERQMALESTDLADIAAKQNLAINQHAAFVHAAQHGNRATPNFTDAIRVHTLIDTAYQAAAERGTAMSV